MKKLNEDIYRPEYYDDIPPESGSERDTWYATTVLEFIISSYRYSCPELYAAIWDEYVRFCHRNNASPGDMSPILGVFFKGWKNYFISRYITYPRERAGEFLRKLKSGEMEQELDFWHHFSHRSAEGQKESKK